MKVQGLAPVTTTTVNNTTNHTAINNKTSVTLTKKDEVSEILKDEINELKQLAKEANKALGEDKTENNIHDNINEVKCEFKKENNSSFNGPIKEDEKQDLNFLQNAEKSRSAGNEVKVKNNLRKSSLNTDEEMKQEFEEKFNYLINKLDIVYQISNNK
jgi:hypothetical protein